MEEGSNQTTHTMKQVNKYFSKLQYIVENYGDLEKKVKQLEQELKTFKNEINIS